MSPVVLGNVHWQVAGAEAALVQIMRCSLIGAVLAAPIHTTSRHLQAADAGTSQQISLQCDNLMEVQRFSRYVATICCDQAHESCTDGGLRFPTTCADPGCAAAVLQMHNECDGFLSAGFVSGGGTCGLHDSVNTATALCAAAKHTAPSVGTVYSIQTTTTIVGCEGIVTDGDGDYGNNMERQLLVRGPPGYALAIFFDEFDVADNDFFSIFDGHTQDVLIGQFTGSKIPGGDAKKPIVTQSNEMLLVFTSDSDGIAAGFRTHLACSCEDDPDWLSFSGNQCGAYSAGSALQDYCDYDGASTPCRASCGHCEACDNTRCGDHGSCQYGMCLCADEYIGTYCEVPPDPCEHPVHIDCGAHGVCNAGACDCGTTGYEGDRCETKTLVCCSQSPRRDSLCAHCDGCGPCLYCWFDDDDEAYPTVEQACGSNPICDNDC
eukprot:SAG11_NODE_3514_length_2400_cov_1.671447_1_plen_435_part_00